MRKDEFVHNLGNVKLIIGNGFDLHCGLHTRYSDFFCKYHKEFKLLKDIANKKKKEIELSDEEALILEGANIWLLFFAIHIPDDPNGIVSNWCDIEKMMTASLGGQKFIDKIIKENDLVDLPSFSWPEIESYIKKNKYPLNHLNTFITNFVQEKMDKLSFVPGKFYEFLLHELKEFEKEFGKFVYIQIPDENRADFGTNPLIYYFKHCKSAIDDLCCKEKLVAIDSFNYSCFFNEEYDELLNHINGSYKKPIFGVDSIFEPDDERFIFTKTSRRIESDLDDDSLKEKRDFENIIIYGHSLNEADYSYFFPVFDKINLLDSNAKGIVVFAYSIFDERKEKRIKQDLRNSMSKLFFSYAKSKGINDAKRFFDSLSTQKKIITYEIPSKITGTVSEGRTLYDCDWDKIYREVYGMTFDQLKQAIYKSMNPEKFNIIKDIDKNPEKYAPYRRMDERVVVSSILNDMKNGDL